MTAAAQLRVLAFGAVLVCSAGGVAQARSLAMQHPRHEAASAHGIGHSRGTPIAFGGRHGHGDRVAMQESGRFSGHRSRFHGRAVFGHFASSGHSGGGIQCVTFARADSGIELSGNASAWWDNAAGVYARGTRPEAGSVLNFRANGAMRMGHVAVVNQVVDSRTIEIDHANWGGPGAVRGGISRDISVVDVSPSNDWSAVRVGLGHSGDYGSIYPTFGFIYNRPDHGTMVASAEHAVQMPALNPAPRDLRARVIDTGYDEVAEAPEGPATSYGHHASSRHHPHHHAIATHHRRAPRP